MSGEKKRGIYEKYIVERVDGSSAPRGKHHGCSYFVLDVTHDEFAIPALVAYAKSCRDKYPELSADIEQWVDRVREVRGEDVVDLGPA